MLPNPIRVRRLRKKARFIVRVRDCGLIGLVIAIRQAKRGNIAYLVQTPGGIKEKTWVREDRCETAPRSTQEGPGLAEGQGAE